MARQSARQAIPKALADKIAAEIDGTGAYNTDLGGNVFSRRILYDDVTSFPCVSVSAGPELREYLPSSQKWGLLTMHIFCYVTGSEHSTEELLENLIVDVENVIDNNQELEYGPNPGQQTEIVEIQTIDTDGGLLADVGMGVGEIVVQAQYMVI